MNLHEIAGSWAAITSGVGGLFILAEQVTRDDAKKNVSLWLRNMDTPASTVNWADEFGRMFDAIFGEKHLSIRCFLVSSAASVISVVIIGILMFSIVPNEIKEELFPETLTVGLIFYIAYVGVFNSVPDYLSVLESRMVISFIKTSDKTSTTIIAVIFDAIFTPLIWIISFLLLLPLISWLFFDADSWWSIIGIIWQGISGLSNIDSELDYFLLILIGSTYFTSVWIWLYLIGGGAIKSYYYLTKTTKLILRPFDLEKKPLLSLGFVSCLLITLLFLISAPFVVSAPVPT